MSRLCDHGMLDRASLLRSFRILWRACGDYSVDKRGDVGSWTRVAALGGMERLIYAAQRMERFTGISTVNCEEVLLGTVIATASGLGVVTMLGQQAKSADTGTVLTVSYSHSSGMGVTEPVLQCCKVRAKVWKMVNYNRHHSEQRAAIDGSWLTTESALTVVCAVLKQIAEKMDSVREVAGQILVRLFNSGLPLDPDDSRAIRTVLEDFVSAEGGTGPAAINWAQPDHAFALVASLMMTRSFLFPVLSGLVLSVGGITATTATASSSCLLRVCSGRHSEESGWFAIELMSAIVTLFRQNAHCDRMVCPLLKTTDILLRRGAVDISLEVQRVGSCEGGASLQPFSHSLVTAIWIETKLCTNVSKLYQIVDLLVLVVALDKRGARLVALQILVRLLGHKYPKIRKCRLLLA